VNDDDLDRPTEDGWGLVVPFVVCRSQGGPFDDDAFVAGFQAGGIDKALAAGAVVGASSLRFTVRTDLLRQLDLLGMHLGFTMTTVEAEDDTEGWSHVEFQRETS
jgi:hypothetical protein